MSAIETFDPHRPDYFADPHTFYRRYREQDPVHWGAPPAPNVPDGCWYVFRYEDVMAVLKEPRLGLEVEMGEVPEPFAPFFKWVGLWMLYRDPPYHTHVRRLVGKAFPVKLVEEFRPRIRAIANELVDKVEAAGGMDLIADFAYPLPVLVVAELLGVPAEIRGQLGPWSTDILHGIDTNHGDDLMESYARATRSAEAFAAYLRELVTEKRQRPGRDLISDLLEVEEDGDVLSEDEIIATCMNLLFAGHETTMNVIGNGMRTLLVDHPDQLALLREDPSLIRGAAEELLRYDTPFHMEFRWAKDDLRLGGKTIGRNQTVAVVLASANRDPALNPEPERFDIRRSPNRHISFGAGIHFCLGAALAQAEIEVAVQTLLERLPGLRPSGGEPEWNRSYALRGLKHFPVVF